jgi:hypothetical protein
LELAFWELAPPADPVTGVRAESSPICTPQPVNKAKTSMPYKVRELTRFIEFLPSPILMVPDSAMGGVLPFFTFIRQ